MSASISGSGTADTISVTGMTGSGSVIVSIPAGSVQDLAGNYNLDSISEDNTVNYALPCYTLTITHTGDGSDPTATPENSTGCSSGHYLAGETITLTATPAAGDWVGSWSGTSDDANTSTTNGLVMPSYDSIVLVNYINYSGSVISRVSISSDGTQGNNHTDDPSISFDGRFVAFESDASNLVSEDTNSVSDIFVHDQQTGQTSRVSVAVTVRKQMRFPTIRICHLTVAMWLFLLPCQ